MTNFLINQRKNKDFCLLKGFTTPKYWTKSLVAVCLFGASSCMYAQKTSKPVTLKNMRVEQALETIEKQSNYVFLYDSSVLDTKRVVQNVPESNDIRKMLDVIFKGRPVSYRVVDKQIILSAKQEQKTLTLKGVIKNELGEPLIGVSVLQEGTSNGTISDIDGNFTVKVPQGSTIVVKYMGFATQRIKATKSPIEVVLLEDNKWINEVVVTALGIKKETKALTYNVQELKPAALTTVKDANFINSLSGKIAGVTINQSASGVGGSSRVVMRGTKSLFGNNNALYVVDGVPLLSMRSDQTRSLWESADGGESDGISSINPEDIESISVLTGAAAAALYGTQGANGVIIVTTKKGEEGKLQVNYSNDTQFMSPFVMPEFQDRYGSEPGSDKSWGAKLDQPSGYSPKDFFQTGYQTTNALSVSSGNKRNQTYLSMATTDARGIVPNNDYSKINFKIRNTAELIEDKLTLDLSASFVSRRQKNMLTQGLYHNPLVPLYLFPRGDSFDKYKVFERYNAERNFPTQFWPYAGQDLETENPYWIVNRQSFTDKMRRYVFVGTLNYKVNDNLTVNARMRMDDANSIYERKIKASSSTLFSSRNGNYMNMETSYRNLYGDLLVTYKKDFEDFGIEANLGTSFTDQKMDKDSYEGHLLSVPNLFTYANIDRNGEHTYALQNGYHDKNQGLYATAQLSYKRWLFLDVTARNDWYSSLAFTDHEHKGFFYPSVGLSGVFSEMFDLSDYGISFLKARASYSEVGNAPMRFRSNTTYSLNGGVLETLPNVPATFLEPERTKAYEFGTNLRMFGDLINLDLTYYNTDTYNQFFTFTMPPSSGYKQFYMNGGKVNNWGLEAKLGVNQEWKDFAWNSTLTFSMNRNKIKELLPDNAKNPITGEAMDIDKIEPFQPQGTYKMMLTEGGTMGDIYVSGLQTDSHGNIMVNPNSGAFHADGNTWYKAGSAAPRYNWGWSNTFRYKNLSLSALITARIGGVGVSATQAIMDRYGVSKASADARDAGGVALNNGMTDAQSYYTVVGGGNTGVLSNYVYSMTNVRLQELSLGYSLPKSWLGGYLQGVDLSLIGKNLLMLYKKAPFDPEITASTSTYYQGFDYFMQPSLRSYGFSIKVHY